MGLIYPSREGKPRIPPRRSEEWDPDGFQEGRRGKRCKKEKGWTLGRTFESTSVFSPHATSTKHSTSAKLASLAGLSLPTETVYVFLCFFFSSARRCFKSGSDPADKRQGRVLSNWSARSHVLKKGVRVRVREG